MSIEGKIVKLAMLNRFYQELPNFFVRKETGKGLSTNDYTDAEKADVAKIADIETALDNKIDGEIIEDGGGFVRGLKVVNDNNYSATLQLPPEGDGKIHFTLKNESTDDFILAQESDITIKSVKVNGTALTPDSNKAVNIKTFYGRYESSGNYDDVGQMYRIYNAGTDQEEELFYTSKTADGVNIGFTVYDGEGIIKGFEAEVPSKTYVTNQIAAGLGSISGVQFQVVSDLPAQGTNGVFYLKANSASSGQNIYDEYVWVNRGTVESPDYGYEKLGTMDVDLTGYIKESDLQFATTEDILAIFNSGGN